MNTTMTSMQEQEQDYFTPATHEALYMARRTAVRMNAAEVTPEHLFLGVLAQDGDGVAEVFSTLRMEQEALRQQVATIFPAHGDAGERDEQSIPLSSEAQTCLEWASSFATHLHVSSVQLEHVLLGSIRHPRLQPLLALFLLNAGGILPSYVTDRSGLAYTATIDQFIASRIRRRRVVRSNHRFPSSILSSFERPTITFADIVGFYAVKQELREVIDFLRSPQLVQQDMRSYLYKLLLIGPTDNSRTLIGQAIAGEAVVPLLSLSIPVLFEMVSSENGDYTESFGDIHSLHTSRRAEMETVAQSGRHMIHDIFEQGEKISPCIIRIDELDMLASPEMKDVREPWQSQLRIEMDGCDIHPAMAIMATVSQHGQIDALPLLSGSFTHTATLDQTDTLKDKLP